MTSKSVILEKGLWILYKHKTKNQTQGKARVIYLSDEMVALTRKLIEKVPAETPFFRNRRVSRLSMRSPRRMRWRVSCHSGSFSDGVMMAIERNDAALGWGVASASGIVAIVGAALVYVRSRVKDESR